MAVERRQVLFLATYPRSQAGTRLRAEAWFPELRRRGLEPDLWSFFSDADSERWFGAAGRAERLLIVLRSLLRAVRVWSTLHRYALVVVLRESVPLATNLLERRAARRSRLVWDVDDAIWTPYPRMFMRWVPERLRRSEHKYRRLAELSAEVWAGSEQLAQWCRQHASAVWVLPTVPLLPPAVTEVDERSGVVWVGSRSTAGFLEHVLPHLAVDGAGGVAVTVVGADVAPVPGVTVTSVPWSEAAEDAALRNARVGLYPLDLAHPLAPARAGFKAVLYMAYGLPAVVTPVPAVADMVRDGVDGIHAHDLTAWGPAVRALLEDDATWRRMSSAARTRAEECYASSAWAVQVADRVAGLAAPSRRSRRVT